MPTSSVSTPLDVIASPVDWRSQARAYFELTKPRLAAMSVLSAMAAYATARPGSGPLMATLVGTSLAAGGALSLNQWWERRTDALMRRTCGRPLPQRLVTAQSALVFSIALSVAGVGLLAAAVNVTAALFALATILIYGVVYTPMKRRTRWATEVGSISGALPALLGSAAAGDVTSRPGLVLTAVLLCWQMPHFFAIGWRHRADYRAAGLPLLPVVDATGQRTASWSFGYAAILLIVSVVPWALGWLGACYGITAALAGGAFLGYAGHFCRASDRDGAARSLFLASILYLPLVMSALVIDGLLG